jgi:hypothetical protein
METVCFSETLVSTYEYIWLHNSEEHRQIRIYFMTEMKFFVYLNLQYHTQTQKGNQLQTERLHFLQIHKFTKQSRLPKRCDFSQKTGRRKMSKNTVYQFNTKACSNSLRALWPLFGCQSQAAKLLRIVSIPYLCLFYLLKVLRHKPMHSFFSYYNYHTG